MDIPGGKASFFIKMDTSGRIIDDKDDQLKDTLFKDNTWHYLLDNGISRSFTDLSERSTPWTLKPCTNCKPLLSPNEPVKLSNLKATEEACPFCVTVIRHVKKSDPPHPQGPPDQSSVSFPHSLRFPLLRAWLQRCDEDHNECMPSRYYDLPTRLLNVSPSKNPADLRLDEMDHSEAIDEIQYIALSHCWGQLPSNQVPPYCTTKQNIEPRRVGFTVADLPRTFQDAIEVTRKLDLQYLWIDSLCILQGAGGDWEQESKRMEDVFASAYCTVAASSASDSSTGFLEHQIDNENTYIQNESGQYLYLSTNLANFDEDVENSQLNQRAWVLQERILSRRTIYFSRNQTKKHFQLDPKFPKRLQDSGFAATLSFLQSFLEDYSRRGITIPTDRAVALSGLVARIAEQLPCEVHHGIFGMFLHRTLLWRRSGQQKLKRIEYIPPNVPVPSWSWMAYEGRIEFLRDDFGTLDLFNDLAFDEQTLITSVWEFTDPAMKLKKEKDGSCYELLDSNDMKKGWVDLDEEKKLPAKRGVVVLAKHKTGQPGNCQYFVLIVRSKEFNDEYERLGIGMIQTDCGLRKKGKMRIL
ncbi:Heterokaryon incompatibility protein [Rutstroemia sp. NJR-2017a WRK4]|nr:Heterokaryon incompatibility protein [Rutstroemia sp. NJR-2017a WRK4]